MAISLAEAKGFLRILGEGEDAAITGMIATATACCETFTGQVLIARVNSEILPASSEWQKLSGTPVWAITGVAGLPTDGTEFALPVASYAVDIDGNGDGWVRVTQPGSGGRIKVTYSAGLAATGDALPTALRQGICRLVAHIFTHRDGAGDGGIPPAVTDLWRPWRRIRLQGGSKARPDRSVRL